MTNMKFVSLAGVLAVTVGLSACQSNPFKREPVPEPRYIPDIALGEVQNLTILPNRVPCSSSLPMQCLVAQQSGSSEMFQIPHDWIEGFEPRAGVEYLISARPQIDQNKQAATGYWTLESVLSQNVVRPSVQ